MTTVSAHAGYANHASGHELSFIRKWVFSVDHKVIGVQYALTALMFLFFGLSLMLIMRWQLAYPGEPVPGSKSDKPISVPIIGTGVPG